MKMLESQLVLKGQNGQQVVLSGAFINDDKELEFKYCSFFHGRVLFNRERKAIELQSKKRHIFILLKGENESVYEKALSLRNLIMQDLLAFNQRFQSGKEPIYVLETGNATYPFFITTPTILEKGRLSPKYVKGLIYFVNQELKKAGKIIRVANEEDLHVKLGSILKQKNITPFKKGIIGETSYFELSMKQFIQML